MTRLSRRLAQAYRDMRYAPARAIRSDFSIAVPFAYPPAIEQRIAIMIHLFHADMAADFRRLVDTSAPGADLLISTDTLEKRRLIATAFAGASGDIDIRIVQNCGRDILPKLTAFKDCYADYDLLLFLHSKKSLHVTSKQDWRSFLLDHLLGTPEIVSSIRSIFVANAQVGMVFPQHFEPLRRFICWGSQNNYPAAAPLIKRLGVAMSPRQPLDFPSGSMFWCRPAALRPLLDLDLGASDFPEEAAQIDGTMGHAIERLFLASVEKAGFDWLKVAIPSHFERQDTIVTLTDAEDVPAFLSAHGFRVTGARY